MNKRYCADPFWVAMNPFPAIDIFHDYLHSMEEFFQTEMQKLTDSIAGLERKLELGEITRPEYGQLPPEFEYDRYWLDVMDGFANTLRRAFFVSLYTFLESGLVKRCRYLEETRVGTLLSVSDIAGRGIGQAMTYLTGVHGIKFPKGTSPEWNKIQHYRGIRNCIVHNEGILDNNTKKRQSLERYVRSNRSLSLSPLNEIILSKDFCLEVIETIAEFLYAIDSTIMPGSQES